MFLKHKKLAVCMAVLLSGCVSRIDTRPEPLPDPLRMPKPKSVYTNPDVTSKPKPSTVTEFERTPHVHPAGKVVDTDVSSIADSLSGPAISVNFNNMPLPVFINEVFGNQLGLSFSIAPSLHDKSDLVTLRLTQRQNHKQLFVTARRVLEEYGVQIVEQNGLLIFQEAQNIDNDTIPLIVSGRALPDVPASHRPVFQIVELKVMRNTQVRKWVSEVFPSNRIQVLEDPDRNAVILRGPQSEVMQAVEAIELFDQPLLKGRHSVAVSPVYAEVKDLAPALVSILQSEGYQASERPPYGSIIVLPLENLNRMIIFAGSRDILNHAKRWVATLDKQTQQSIESGLFTYQVQNVQADTVAQVLSDLGYSTSGMSSTSSSSGASNSSEQTSGSNNSAANTNRRSTTNSDDKKRVVVDSNRNAIIFRGSGRDWLELQPLLQELDKAVPSVLVEVLLAEVTLTDTEGSGVEWAIKDGNLDVGINLDTVGSKGLSMVLDNGGSVKAKLNLFYENSRAVLRSSPKLMVRSGEEARIEVGDEIPIVTGTTDSSEGTQTSTQVQYRKTGVILSITPTVQASGLVDITIEQELSEQTERIASSASDNPVIMNRKVKTSLTLQDGGSVLLAGLISGNKSGADNGVPILSDLPLIGNLFKNKSNTSNRTELMVMIIPYVVNNSAEAEALTETFQNRLSMDYDEDIRPDLLQMHQNKTLMH